MTADAPAWDGVPENPEKDGWHWLVGALETPAALEWRASVKNPHVRGWYLHRAQHGVIYANEMTLWRYLGPCLTPSEVAALATARADALREIAHWHDGEAALARDTAYATKHRFSADQAMGRSSLHLKSRDAILALIPKKPHAE